MIKLKDKQFVVDSKGNRIAVLLDIRAYEKLIEALEELEDIRAYDKTKHRVESEIRDGNYITLEEYKAKRKGKTD